MRAERPIGIFDSGLGGLTVFKAVRRALPKENIIYFGDTAHVPYGSKSAETVINYSLEIALFLSQKNIKLLVIACNSASAMTVGAVRKALKIPVLEVIIPGAKAALSRTKTGRIAVIGTEATIKSGAYRRALKKLGKASAIFEKACPMFVPLIEEGWWHKPVTKLVAREYLSPLKKHNIDTIILGCTHYPVIKKTIRQILGAKVAMVDSAESVAAEVLRVLSANKILKSSGRGKAVIYASDAPQRFKRLAKNILNEPFKKVLLKKFS